MNRFTDKITEPVFLATTPAELEGAIELLDAHGITFTTDRASFVDPRFVEGVREGIAFRVLTRQAEFCREALTARGLGRSVLPAGATDVARARELTLA